MPRNPIASVEIVEPPIGELTKTRSSFKRACFTSCLFLLILIGLAVLGLKLLIGSGPSTIKAVPPSFPAGIPVYDKDTIHRITFIPGKYKYRSTEIAAFFPKIILSPIVLRIQGTESSINASSSSGLPSLNDVWRIVATPVSELKDTVQIEWRNLDAEPSFIYTYYRKELSKKGFAIEDEVRNRERQHFSFHDATGVTGFLVIEGDEEAKPGTDYAALTVNIPFNASTAP